MPSAPRYIGKISPVFVDTIQDLRDFPVSNANKIPEYVSVRGYYAIGDGGGGPDRYWVSGAAPGTYVDNGGSIIVPTGGDGSAAWLWEYSGINNLKWFGAKVDSVTDDTIAVQRAVNASSAVFSPPGICVFSDIIIPSTCHAFLGAGAGASVIRCGGVIPAFTPWLQFASISGIEIFGLSIDQNKTTYSTNHCFYFGSCQFISMHDCVVSSAGFIGVYAAGCSKSTFDNVVIVQFSSSAFQIEVGCTEIGIINCKTLSAGTSHSITINGGSNNFVRSCFVYRTGPTNFCVSITSEDCDVTNNHIVTNTKEGINVQDVSRATITGNTIICETGHDDFGISLYAAVSAVEKCLVSGNNIIDSGKAGIGVASTNGASAFCRYNTIIGNEISNPDRLAGIAAAESNGVTVYGVNTTGNIIRDNTLLCEDAVMLYGVAEWNDGTGAPTFNIFQDNEILGGSGVLAECKRLGTTTKIYNSRFESWTPTITPSAGAITAYTVNLAKFRPRGELMEIILDVTITTNGTGSGAILVSEPAGYGAVANAGLLSGRESAISGVALTGQAGSANLTYRKYDNSYPGADGARILSSGSYLIA